MVERHKVQVSDYCMVIGTYHGSKSIDETEYYVINKSLIEKADSNINSIDWEKTWESQYTGLCFWGKEDTTNTGIYLIDSSSPTNKTKVIRYCQQIGGENRPVVREPLLPPIG